MSAPRGELSRRMRATALAYAVWLAGFEGVGWYARTLPARDLSLPIDAWLPLRPEWIWVYELTYALPFVAPLAIVEAERFDRTLRAVLIAGASACVVYLLLPVAFARPVLGDSLAERVLALEYARDFPPGANNLPSLHVANAFILYQGVCGQRLHRLGEHAALALCFAIAASTLFVKQHLVLDVVAGLLWAKAAFIVADRPGVSAVTRAACAGSVRGRRT